jgi:hypothetical protein
VTAPDAGRLQPRTPESRSAGLLASVWRVSARSLLERLLYAALVVGVVAVGYLQGSFTMVLGLPAVLGGSSVAVLQAVFDCLTLSGLFGLSGVVLARQLALDGHDRTRTTGSTVTAVVPVHRDASVLHRSVESLLTSRYEDLQIVVVDEPDDEASVARARELANDDRVEVLVNTRYPGSKAPR